MAFKMKGWSPFTLDGEENVGEEHHMLKTMTKKLKKKEYTPQTITRADVSTDITPQSQQKDWDEETMKTSAASIAGGAIPFIGEFALKNLKKKK